MLVVYFSKRRLACASQRVQGFVGLPKYLEEDPLLNQELVKTSSSGLCLSPRMKTLTLLWTQENVDDLEKLVLQHLQPLCNNVRNIILSEVRFACFPWAYFPRSTGSMSGQKRMISQTSQRTWSQRCSGDLYMSQPLQI